MNIEPCVRLGMRISPKISEKPADSRNKRPPNVTLLTVSSSQKLICAALSLPAVVVLVRNPGVVRRAIRDQPIELYYCVLLRSIRAPGNETEAVQHLVSGG